MIATALRALGGALGAVPQLNLWVRTAPRGAAEFCWHIDIAPRLTIEGRLRARHRGGDQRLPARARGRGPARGARLADLGRALEARARRRVRCQADAARPPALSPLHRRRRAGGTSLRALGGAAARGVRQGLRAARRRGGLGARPDDGAVVPRPRLGRSRLRSRQRSRLAGDQGRGGRGGPRRVLRLGLVRRRRRRRRAQRPARQGRLHRRHRRRQPRLEDRPQRRRDRRTGAPTAAAAAM